MFWRARLPEITPLLILEADPFPKYFVKEGVPSNMPLVSLKKTCTSKRIVVLRLSKNQFWKGIETLAWL